MLYNPYYLMDTLAENSGYLSPLLKHKEDVIEFEEKNLYFFKKSGDYSEYFKNIRSKIY